jgi:hypothetical protein
MTPFTKKLIQLTDNRSRVQLSCPSPPSIKGDALNFLRISFCQLKIVLTINYLVHLQRVSKQGGMNSKTPN